MVISPIFGVTDMHVPAQGLIPRNCAFIEFDEQGVVFVVKHDFHVMVLNCQRTMMVFTISASPSITAAQTRLGDFRKRIYPLK
jgi:hypothetical protein